jgi:hypothetical protein
VESSRRRRFEPSVNKAWKSGLASAEAVRTERLPIQGAVTDKATSDTARHTSVVDRVASLKSYRRARGLCDRCAEKWSHGHRCATTVQLHAIEEVWELLGSEETTEEVSEPEQQIMMVLSMAAWAGHDTPSTFRLQGMLQNQELLVLIDSGSSHTFLNSKLLPLLQGVDKLSTPITVQVANGQILKCEHYLLAANWVMSGVQFSADLKFLPLPSFDLVVGMDWFTQYSPMKIDWANKWITIQYQGHSVRMQDVLSFHPGARLELMLISDTEQCQVSIEPVGTHTDPRLVTILLQFAELFSEPVGLPPNRQCDHAIPLIDGAQPCNVKPYRYPPLLKDEIEKQVKDMLEQGVIQKSHNSFASPVLLVKKKDHTWRFFVDYRYLNALTIKSKYPVPIFDQLMDELSAAKWFIKLDLRVGYHQILLQQGEEHKTAFQTHMGHFEFRVMAFGLTSAPNTFLEAMNDTLAPVLRKCDLVFFMTS